MAAEGTRTVSGSPAGGSAVRPLGGLPARARAALVLVAVAALLVAAAVWLRFLWGALHSAVGQYDFSTYYAAALALRHHLHADIYAPAVLAQAGAAAQTQVQPPLPYTYPPLFAYLLIPFTFVSFHLAARAWLAVNVAIWLGCVALLAAEVRRYLRPRLAVSASEPAPVRNTPGFAALWARTLAEPSALVALALVAALALPFAPAQQTLLLGQIDFVVLLPLALVPWLTRTGHERWVGVAIACAAMLKLTPGILLVYLVLRRRWEALAAAVVALVALTLLSMLLIGPGTFLALIPQALHVGTGDASLGQNEALFAPAFAALGGGIPGFAALARPLTYALLAALALVLGWVLWRAPRPSREWSANAPYPLGADYPAYAMALCAMVLLSPTAWVHHYLWLLPAAALALMPLGDALAASPGTDRRRATILAVLAVVGCILLAITLPNQWDTQPTPSVTLLVGLPLRWLALEARPIGGVLVLLVAAALALRPFPAPTIALDTPAASLAPAAE